MPLPKEKDPTDEVADALAYTAARTAANPKTTEVAARLRPLIPPLDEALQKRRLAKRAEFEVRAVRDFIDDEGDGKVAAFRRRLAAATGPADELLNLVFPDPVKEETRPVGEAQAVAWRELLRRCDLAGQSSALANAANQEELRGLLAQWRQAIAESLGQIDGANAAVVAARDVLSLARDAEHAAKVKAIDEARRALRRLADILGSEKEANSYTPPAPKRADDPEPPPSPTPPA